MKPGPPPLAAMRPNAARLSQRTQRTTKVHEEYDAGEPQISEEHKVAQRIQRVTETDGVLAHAGLPECFYHKGHEGHKEHVAGAGRACARGTRPARRACRGMAGFARHALVFGESSGDSPVLYVLYVLYVLPRRPLARRRRAGGAGAVGSLEAWMLGSLVSLHNDCFVARLPRALFSVFCGRGRFGPLGLHALFSGAR